MFPSRRIQMLLLALMLASASTICWGTEPAAGPQKDLPEGQKTRTAPEKAEAPAQATPARVGAETGTEKNDLASSPAAKTTALAAEQTQVYATKMLNEIIEGISEGDYNKYTRNLSPEMRKFQTRQVFLELQKKLQKNLGKLQSLTYLGFYDQLGKRLGLFKARFEKDKDDALITIVLEVQEKEPKAGGLWFDAPALERR
ncbi:MAG: hypothetical protein V1792_16725 [Pseudomonadota bacterium]